MDGLNFIIQIIRSRISIYTLCAIVLLVSCKVDDKTHNGSVSIDIREVNSTIRPSVKREIKLSTDTHDPIGDIIKFVGYDNYFFILDFPSRTIWKFSESGEFKGKLQNIGNGVGEYSMADDIDVFPNGDLCVMDINQRKILRYNGGSLDFISEFHYPGIALKLSAVDTTTYFFNNASTTNVIDIKLGRYKNSKKIEQIFKSKHKDEHLAMGANDTHLWRSGREVVYYDRFTPNFYHIMKDSVTPLFSIITDNLPTENDVPDLINATKRLDFSSGKMNNHTIMDVLYAYKLSNFVLFGLNTTPQQHILANIDNGTTYKLDLSDNPLFYGAMVGAVGIFKNCFVTTRMPSDDEANPSLILFEP